MLVVTSLKFIALEETDATNVVLVPNSGAFGSTRVLIGPSNITGDISSVAVVTVAVPQGACCLGACGCEIVSDAECTTMGGSWKGANSSCALDGGVPTACQTCPGDITLDGVVNVDDLLAVINSWGPPTGSCSADVDQNNVVNVDDLLVVINTWGACPP
jgi:hypothetical protein